MSYVVAGGKDCVRCFACGGGLRNWESGLLIFNTILTRPLRKKSSYCHLGVDCVFIEQNLLAITDFVTFLFILTHKVTEDKTLY